MNTSINPNTYYLKALFIVDSCSSINHIQVAEKCIELYDKQGDYFTEFFKHSSLKPIVAHTGDYDHEMAVWILKKKLNNKKL